MDRLSVTEERNKLLVELKNKCNKIYEQGNFKSRLSIVNKNGQNQFVLNTEPSEFDLVYKIMADEFKSLGLDQIDAELK